MKTDDYYLNLIEDYTEGMLNEAERNEFELKLKSDEQLAHLYHTYQEAQQLLELQAGQLLKQKLQEMTPKEEPLGKTRRIPMRRYVLAIAAVLTLLIMFIGFRGMKNQYSNQALLENYASVYSTGPSRGNQQQDQTWEKAAEFYTQKNYQKAIELFANITPESSRFIEAQFFMGNAALLTGDYNTAISSLQRVIASNDLRFAQAADWYLVLATFGAGNEAQSKELVEKIFATQNHPYQDIARDFMADLDSFLR